MYTKGDGEGVKCWTGQGGTDRWIDRRTGRQERIKKREREKKRKREGEREGETVRAWLEAAASGKTLPLANVPMFHRAICIPFSLYLSLSLPSLRVTPSLDTSKLPYQETTRRFSLASTHARTSVPSSTTRPYPSSSSRSPNIRFYPPSPPTTHPLHALSLSLSLSLSLLECYAQDSATSYSIHLCPSLLLFFLIRAKFARL